MNEPCYVCGKDCANDGYGFSLGEKVLFLCYDHYDLLREQIRELEGE